MDRARKLVFIVVALVLLCVGLVAQNIASANLHGVVRDPNGAMIPNATITAHQGGQNIERRTQSNANGEYVFLSLPPGIYSINAEAPGFAKLLAKQVVLTTGQDAELPMNMKIAAANEEVTVESSAELIETQRSSESTTIDRERIENLPINGRNYINFALTNSQLTRDDAPSIGAAPTSGLNVGGQRARANLVNLDGMNNVDNSTNGIRSTVSQEAVQEFQIITNGYAAEYGQAAGGVVNIITKGGTNDLHGSAFAYLRNRNIEATNPFSTVKDPAYTRVQPGATVGGPIVKNKTFYFFSFETTRRHETGFSSIGQNNFGLTTFDASRFFGAPAGAVMLLGTQQQAAFLNGIPNAALANASVAKAVASYAGLVGGSSATAVNGTLPVALGGVPAFITTGAPLPASFHSLASQEGNFPVFEGTTVYSLRLDHKLTNNQQLMLRGNVSPSTVTGIEVNGQNQTFGQNSYSRTSQQTYRDIAITGQHSWVIGNSKVNELRYEYSRRGLLYNFSGGPGGGDVAINIPGFAFTGREPFSFVNRTEQRHEVADNFSWSLGNHNVKFGGDVNHLPIKADFTVNFGGLYNFGALDATSLSPSFGQIPGFQFPQFSPVQAFGLGIPQTFVQGVGNPHDEFTNNTLGFFAQDQWRIKPNLTLNYGVRYDVEFLPTFPASNSIAAAAQTALGITQGIPRDNNNIAPRVGIAWDPFKTGKTVLRASYGMFYDHPLLGLAFDSDVADGSQAPQVILFGGSPCNPANPSTQGAGSLNATNSFQGIQTSAACALPAALAQGLQYLPSQQRYNALNANSIFVNQQYLTAGLPLINQPFSFPIASNFQYAYSEQVNLGVERDLGHNYSLSINYNYNGGHHINRPINANPVESEALVTNFQRAFAATSAAAKQASQAFGPNDPRTVALTQAIPSSPLSVAVCPQALGLPAGTPNFAPAAILSFFRKAGVNPSIPIPPVCAGAVQAAASEFGLGIGVPVPFSDAVANYSNGSAVYHGLTTNLRKRFSDRYEFLVSYTWSHAIDDSTDLQSLLAPQDSRNPNAERSESTFDQRHRLVVSSVYQSGRLGGSNWLARALSNFTVAPIVEASSGRPFNILVGADRNFDFGPNTDRPLAVAANTPVNGCGDVAVSSKYSPTGFLQPACFLNGTLVGNLKRNAGIKPSTVFTDLRIGRTFGLTERFKLDGTVDMFNLINKFNVADVNVLWNQAGQATAAFDPRQFQFGLKLTF
jgi:hypothetical protein